MKQFLKNKLQSLLIFTFIMVILSIIYSLILCISNSSFTYNSFLVNNHYFPYFIGLFSFLILGIISGIKEKKKGIIAGLSSSLILLIMVFFIKLINDTLQFNLSIVIKYCSYIFISIFGGILGVNNKKR